jgi:hypothetical protein
MPKVDCLVDGSLPRDRTASALGLAPERPTVLYAPTWSPASSLNKFGAALLARLRQLPVNVVIKLHDRSCDRRPQYSGGVDWVGALSPMAEAGRVLIAAAGDICPYLAAADVLITDHSSAGFEFLLLDRPVIRIHVPELLALADVHPDYVRLLASASRSTDDVESTVAAVEHGLANPAAESATRKAVAADLFYRPGSATSRSVSALYEAIQLEPKRSPGAVRLPTAGASFDMPPAITPFPTAPDAP